MCAFISLFEIQGVILMHLRMSGLDGHHNQDRSVRIGATRVELLFQRFVVFDRLGNNDATYIQFIESTASYKNLRVSKQNSHTNQYYTSTYNY